MQLGIAGKSIPFVGRSKGMGGVAARMLVAKRCKVAIVARGKDAIDEAVVERLGHARYELIRRRAATGRRLAGSLTSVRSCGPGARPSRPCRWR